MLDDPVLDDLMFDDPALDDPETLFCPDCPKRRNPLFELTFELVFEPTFDLTFELVFPGRATSRPLPVNLPSCRLEFATCGRPSSTERVAAVLPRAVKKC